MNGSPLDEDLANREASNGIVHIIEGPIEPALWDSSGRYIEIQPSLSIAEDLLIQEDLLDDLKGEVWGL